MEIQSNTQSMSIPLTQTIDSAANLYFYVYQPQNLNIKINVYSSPSVSTKMMRFFVFWIQERRMANMEVSNGHFLILKRFFSLCRVVFVHKVYFNVSLFNLLKFDRTNSVSFDPKSLRQRHIKSRIHGLQPNIFSNYLLKFMWNFTYG